MIEKVVDLFCLVHGESTRNAFKVKIGENEDVSDLRDEIKNKKPNAFANIDADKLTLWGVSIPFDNADATLAGLELEDSDEKGTKKLRPTDRISTIFPGDPPENSIHIIVQPPVTG